MVVPGAIWLTKMILSHLVTDFMLQPKSWVTDRESRHFSSVKLYIHGAITGVLAWFIAGWQYWPVAFIILVTHTLIDGWKSYRPKTVTWFLTDQLLHIFVILICWYFTFMKWEETRSLWGYFNGQLGIWKTMTAFAFLTTPAGILIGQLTKQWRDKIRAEPTDTESLANAGKWIGIVERLIILTFVLQNQFSAIGLLVAAKGIIRFNEKDRQETKTEYLVIGTLMSIGMAVITGLLIRI